MQMRIYTLGRVDTVGSIGIQRKREATTNILMIRHTIYMNEGVTDPACKSPNNKSIRTLLFAAATVFYILATRIR